MHIILGPPGTGKTTKLLSMVEDAMDRGVPPDRIGYFSFTRRAADEAMERAIKRFRLTRRDLPYFRTLHSLAKSVVGIDNKSIMQGKHYQECAQWLKIPMFSELVRPDDGPYQEYGLGDRFLEVINMSRICLLPLREVYNKSSVPETTDYAMVEYVDRGLRKYKDANGLFDFTDMLELFVKRKASPPFDLVFIDEVQDLSPLQWLMVHQIAERSKQVVIAGDDDQAIYRWAGADVEYFIRLDGTTEVLGQSYRIPASHHAMSQHLISSVQHRRRKEFLPRPDEGVVKWHSHSEEVDLNENDWLLLARTRRLAKQLEQEVRQRGMLYSFSLSKDVDHESMEAIRLWEALRRGETLVTKDVRRVYRQMRVNESVARGHKTMPDVHEDAEHSIESLITDHGLLTKASWEDALSAIPEDEKTYYKACLRRGEDFTRPPRIRISTIHSAKGAEATNVLLVTDFPQKGGVSVRRNAFEEDDEKRVFYVGLTRAKKELHLIHPMHTKGFPLT
jgi:DNA helicase-2/ATP-dependent DNA helicase PcrA